MDMSRSPNRTIWHLAWPQILMMLFHFLIGMADVWVAGYINREVQASLGIISQSLFFLLVVAVAVANGSVAAISQSTGAGLHARVKRYVGLCLILAAILGGLFLILGMPLKNLLILALQVPEKMQPVTEYFPHGLPVRAAALLPADHHQRHLPGAQAGHVPPVLHDAGHDAQRRARHRPGAGLVGIPAHRVQGTRLGHLRFGHGRGGLQPLHTGQTGPSHAGQLRPVALGQGGHALPLQGGMAPLD